MHENNYADILATAPGADSVDICQKFCLQQEKCYFWMLDFRGCVLFKSTATAVSCEDGNCLRGPRVCQGKDNVNRILASLKSNNDNDLSLSFKVGNEVMQYYIISKMHYSALLQISGCDYYNCRNTSTFWILWLPL